MIKQIDITNRIKAQEVLNIQIPSYKVEAEIINFYDIPPLKDTVETLQQCGETFFGYYLNDELCGAIAIKVDSTLLDIHRLIVHPEHFRKGIAKKLLEFIERNYNEVESIIVNTGAKNTPAIKLYEKFGFKKIDEIIVNEQLTIHSFKKNFGIIVEK